MSTCSTEMPKKAKHIQPPPHHCTRVPSRPGPPHYCGFTITLRHTTLGRTTLDEWSARRRDLYLTTHNTHYRQTYMSPVGYEPTIPASRQSQTHASKEYTQQNTWEGWAPCSLQATLNAPLHGTSGMLTMLASDGVSQCTTEPSNLKKLDTSMKQHQHVIINWQVTPMPKKHVMSGSNALSTSSANEGELYEHLSHFIQ
jgi:hypothetical protein